MNKPKGGRGKKSDYNTEMIRIPEPIKPKVLELKQRFYDGILQNDDDNLIERESLQEDNLNLISTLEDALNIAAQIIADNTRQKKSVKYVVAKLISSLYNADVKPTDLGV